MHSQLRERIRLMRARLDNAAPIAEIRAESQLFVTPAPVCERLVTLAEISNRDHILEPSAGTGAISGGNLAPSCQSVRCDNPGTVHPQRSRDRIATVWIAPWVDSDNAFHQPGRVSFVVTPAEWLLPSRIN